MTVFLIGDRVAPARPRPRDPDAGTVVHVTSHTPQQLIVVEWDDTHRTRHCSFELTIHHPPKETTVTTPNLPSTPEPSPWPDADTTDPWATEPDSEDDDHRHVRHHIREAIDLMGQVTNWPLHKRIDHHLALAQIHATMYAAQPPQPDARDYLLADDPTPAQPGPDTTDWPNDDITSPPHHVDWTYIGHTHTTRAGQQPMLHELDAMRALLEAIDSDRIHVHYDYAQGGEFTMGSSNLPSEIQLRLHYLRRRGMLNIPDIDDPHTPIGLA